MKLAVMTPRPSLFIVRRSYGSSITNSTCMSSTLSGFHEALPLIGSVTISSSAMEKTIVVKVDVITSHHKYKKVIRRSVKFHAHDEQNSANVGDVVRIVETRPLPATKHWRLAEILEVAK